MPSSATGPLRPFDEADRARVEIFPKAGVNPLRRIGEAIEIEMVERKFPIFARERVGFDERVGWAAHAPRMTEPRERRAHERGFAGAEIAEQLHMQAAEMRQRARRLDRLRETGAECIGRREIVEREATLEQRFRGRKIR